MSDFPEDSLSRQLPGPGCTTSYQLVAASSTGWQPGVRLFAKLLIGDKHFGVTRLKEYETHFFQLMVGR